MSGGFPITGVVGVVAGDPGSVAAALEAAAGRSAARGRAIEVRADLFRDPREALDLVARVGGALPVLFTVRLPVHGGQYRGPEAARIQLYHDALARGARLADAELGSEAARALAREGAPRIVSHHDFASTPASAELERLTRDLSALAPLAVKLVTAARTPADGARMLEWVAARRPGEPHRIGFAMGEAGLPSRVFSLARGSPLTYATLGAAVASGQVSLEDMVELYRAERLGRATRMLGVAGNPVAHSLSPHMHNPALAARGIDAVYLPLRLETFSDLEPVLDPLGIDGLSVTIPFKEDALRFAGEADEAARSSGAANTLVFRRPEAGRRLARAYNTDIEGVLGPLRRRGIELRGLSAAVIGNGGAARGAAKALRDAGAEVTLHVRSLERGSRVASELGVRAAPLGGLAAGRHGLVINATPLGLKPGDPSPVPAEAFDARTVAFDMVYDPPETAFLEAARSRGARCIPGREMLVCQGIEQLRLFTGRDATYEELEAGFLRGQAARRR